MTDILKVVIKSQLKGATGQDRDEYVNPGDILQCRAKWDSGVLLGYRYIEAVNGSYSDYRVGRYVKDADLIPYDETPTEPPAQTLKFPAGKMTIIGTIDGVEKSFRLMNEALFQEEVESNG